jgi:hypothetical protein
MKPMYQVWFEPTVKGVSSGWQSKPVGKPMLNLEDDFMKI